MRGRDGFAVTFLSDLLLFPLLERLHQLPHFPKNLLAIPFLPLRLLRSGHERGAIRPLKVGLWFRILSHLRLLLSPPRTEGAGSDGSDLGAILGMLTELLKELRHRPNRIGLKPVPEFDVSAVLLLKLLGDLGLRLRSRILQCAFVTVERDRALGVSGRNGRIRCGVCGGRWRCRGHGRCLPYRNRVTGIGRGRISHRRHRFRE